MNADLQKLRDSRLFKHLPDRAFERVREYIKIRSFERVEQVQDLKTDRSFARYFGYVLSGKVVFVGAGGKPLGLAVRDEFFLGRAFSIKDQKVETLVSADEGSLVVYIRKEVFEVLARASSDFAELIEDIHDSIFERAEMMASDAKGAKAFEEWQKQKGASSALDEWIAQIDKRRQQAEQKKVKESRERTRNLMIWSAAVLLMAALGFETYLNVQQIPWSLTHFLTGSFPVFDPGSDYNIALGIIGYALILSTNLHTMAKWAIRKLKWKIDFKLSSQLHMVLGATGGFFILFHTAFHIQGGNIAHYALYAVFVGIVSGMVGQIISAQIPKSIRGEKLKLDSLQKEQNKLRQQAELLLDDQQFKTSVALIAQPISTSFWGNIFGFHRLWWRRHKIRRALKGLGMGRESAGLASALLVREFRLRQKIRGLELANQIFRRWMLIHKPFGYAVYILGGLHIIIAVFLT